jgi:type IV secretion system protein VirB3
MEKIAEDKVFLALTRPSVFMGLPMEAILPIIMVCMVLWGSFTTRSIPWPCSALSTSRRAWSFTTISMLSGCGVFGFKPLSSPKTASSGGGSYSPVRLKTGVKRRQFGND